MQGLADRVILASGWARRLIALIAGAVGALAMAPISFGPAMIVPMVVAVWLLDGSSERRGDFDVGSAEARRFGLPSLGSARLAFGAGWWLGFGYFLAGFWWLGAAFLVEPDYAWALPLGVVGVPFLLAFFMGFGFMVARLLWAPGVARVFALALGLGLSEWLRGAILTGFPWNTLGMALGGTLVTAQLAALVGVDGLTLVAVALFATPATLVDGGAARWRPTLVAASIGLLLVAFGAARLSQTPPGTVPHVVVRIMQPGLRPDEKFRIENRDEILDHYFALSREDDAAKNIKLADVTLLVWPESAFPFILARDAQALSAIGALLPPKTVLVTGAAREQDYPARAGKPAYSAYFNSIEVVASGGTLLDSYDKIHLVPFGEYLPFEAVLSRIGLRRFVSIPGGFEPGTRRRPLVIPGLPGASPSICYEAIFSGAVMPDEPVSGGRPSLLLNVTNDGWFGMTSGPPQHFAQARLRAIEEGLPMIRAAATGISAIIDPFGRIEALLPLGNAGIVDGLLPEKISPTIFARYPTVSRLFLIIFMLLTLFIFRQLNRRRAM